MATIQFAGLKRVLLNKYLLLVLVLLFCSDYGYAQAPKKLNAVEIHESIKKLNFLGSVLYIAAHPDDENTRMISYFSNEVHARTGYLSITRGDGGQNLIGPEIRELLGVIRTNELLKARATDGGEQFFTRANDFGYSKHPKETLRLWNKEAVLNDVVKVIRKFRPDIIINRFNAESAGKTHGHHTSSAILSTEAFGLAGDPDYASNGESAWAPKRLFFNTHWWFYGSEAEFDEVDKSNMIWFDTGVYFPGKGLSNSEIASLSRSMHKSQGFGSTGTRGSDKEYIELIKGAELGESKDVFEGINTTWTRVEGGAAIQGILLKVENDFDFRDPSKSIPALLEAYKLISNLKDDYWRTYKTKQIKEIIASCGGIYLEGVSEVSTATNKESLGIKLEAINRSNQNISLESIKIMPQEKILKVGKALRNNETYTREEQIRITDQMRLTSPYWLEQKGSLGMYKVEDPSLIGQPVSSHDLKVAFVLDFGGTQIEFVKDIVYKYNDPVEGEVYQPFEIVPDVTTEITSKVVIFNEFEPKEIPVKIKSFRDSLDGSLKLKVPAGWTVKPDRIEFELENKGEESIFNFVVSPPKDQSEGFIKPIVSINGLAYDKTMAEISYDHIPRQLVMLPSESKVVRLNLMRKGQQIAYIKGAGDEIPKYLRQIGYEVTEIEPKSLSPGTLKNYDALIMGIRAYNTIPELKLKQDIIFEYVSNGGNVIVQYNTNHRLVVEDNLAPYMLELSRDRITDENARVTFLAPDHEVMNFPNKIVKEDFDGWVQERGLYFPNKWADEFSPILSFQENGDDPMNGSLLVAKYGKGHYMYTGLSFFRELPAGVPGAYKLFTNMISVGKNNFEIELKE